MTMVDMLACSRCGRRLRGSHRLRLCGPCSHQQQVEAFRALSEDERRERRDRQQRSAWAPRNDDAE